VLLIGLTKFTLIEEGVQFYLIHRRSMSGLLYELVEIVSPEIAHPDRPNVALREKLYRGLVGVDSCLKGGGDRPMKQIQVEEIKP
jgi:hypothetical protein